MKKTKNKGSKKTESRRAKKNKKPTKEFLNLLVSEEQNIAEFGY